MNLEPPREAFPQGTAGTRAADVTPLHPAPRPLDGAVDAGDFERRLMTLALSAESGSPSRAWILRRLGEGRMAVGCESPAGAPAGELDPRVCGAAVLSAWQDGSAAWSAGAGAEAPWSGAAAIGAYGFRLDGGNSLLVVAWDAAPAPGVEARFRETARYAREAARAREASDGWRRSRERRNALAEWLRAATGSHHVSEALRACGRAALEVSDARIVAIWTRRPDGSIRLAHTAGDWRDRESHARELHDWAERVVSEGAARLLEGAELEASAAGLGSTARARLLPVIASGRVLGVLGIVEFAGNEALPAGGAGAEQGRAGEADPSGERETGGLVDLLAVTDGLALLLDRAVSTEGERAGQQAVRELRARLRRQEWLATVGERAAGALGEARHPLASIGAFARRAHRELDAQDPRREYLEVIVRESERLERLVAESAEPLEPEPARLRMMSVNAVLQEVLPGVGEKLVRRRVRLLKRLDPESPALLLDVDRVRQVFRNIIERAVDGVPVGGRVRVESRLVRDHVVVEIAFDGGHSPGDLLEELFVPFTPEAARGSPGLGVADRIVRQHGGEVRVRADGEWGAAVLVTLPVRDNEERRRAGADRRRSRADRRGDAPAA